MSFPIFSEVCRCNNLVVIFIVFRIGCNVRQYTTAEIQILEHRLWIHEDVLQECYGVIYRRVTPPCLISSGVNRLVRRECTCLYSMTVLPVTVQCPACIGCGNDTLQEYVVVLIVAYLLSVLILSVNVDMFRREYNDSGIIRIPRTRNSGIDIYPVCRIEIGGR